MPKIAISYRRADSDVTGRVFDRLVLRYGKESVFRDIDNIPYGIDFRKVVNDALQNTDVLIAIVGPNWRGRRKRGGARINEANDPVRIEIETALQRDIPVIPVLVGGALMPQSAELPDSLRDFSFRNAANIDSGRNFDTDVERLMRSMDRLFQQTVAVTPVAVPVRQREIAEDQPQALVEIDAHRIKIGNMRDVESWGWNAEFLLKKLVALDHDRIEELTDEAEGTAENWATLFSEQPYSWRLAFDVPKNILGYWEMHPLFPEPFEMAKRGDLVDGQLDLSMIDILTPHTGTLYNVYFSMIAITREAKKKYNNEVFDELRVSMYDVLNELSEKGIFINEIAAVAWTTAGDQLCKHFGLRETGRKHTKYHKEIYCGSIFNVLKRRPNKFPNLLNRYVQRFKAEQQQLI
jgi:hypothetical protein